MLFELTFTYGLSPKYASVGLGCQLPPEEKGMMDYGHLGYYDLIGLNSIAITWK